MSLLRKKPPTNGPKQADAVTTETAPSPADTHKTDQLQVPQLRRRHGMRQPAVPAVEPKPPTQAELDYAAAEAEVAHLVQLTLEAVTRNLARGTQIRLDRQLKLARKNLAALPKP